MEKENSASGGGGGGVGGGGGEAAATATPGATSASEKLQADQANPLLDPTALFGGKPIFLLPLYLFFSPFYLSYAFISSFTRAVTYVVTPSDTTSRLI